MEFRAGRPTDQTALRVEGINIMIRNSLLISFAALVLAGCGTPETNEHLSTPQPAAAHTVQSPSILETYIGGVIFKVDRTKPLPNVFGKPDIFGRKVYAGYTELRYQGLTEEGRILLRLTEAETQSNETTMTRSGQSTFDGRVDQQGNVSGTLTRPPQGSTVLLPANTTEFAFDPTKEKELTIAGTRVRFVEYKPQGLKFSLIK